MILSYNNTKLNIPREISRLSTHYFLFVGMVCYEKFIYKFANALVSTIFTWETFVTVGQFTNGDVD